jgi:hypothetical protein
MSLKGRFLLNGKRLKYNMVLLVIVFFLVPVKPVVNQAQYCIGMNYFVEEE